METPNTPASYELWKLPAVRARVPYSETSIYRLMREGKFPKPLKVGARAVAWRSDEVLAFIEALPRSSVGNTEAFYSVAGDAA